MMKLVLLTLLVFGGWCAFILGCNRLIAKLEADDSQETFVDKVDRLNREIAERYTELQLLVCGDPMRSVTFGPSPPSPPKDE